MSDDDQTVGPQQGTCSVKAWTVGFDDPPQILGVMPWADLIQQVEDQGGTRRTYDLFDVPQDDGTVLRYWAMDVCEAAS